MEPLKQTHKPIGAVLIDDEERALINLRTLLNEHCPEVTILAEANGSVQGLKAIKAHNPDLVFLDIEMPDGTGFDLLEQFPAKDFHVIFCTAFDQYALKAFKFSALDYLLKPVNLLELVAAVTKFSDRRATQFNPIQYDLLQQNLKDKQYQQLALPSMDGLSFVHLNDIIRCEGSSSYIIFHLANGKQIMVSKKLKYYEQLLAETGFFRVHQSHLVSMRHITKYHKGRGGYLTLTDGSNVEVSSRKKEEFLKHFQR